MTGPTEVPEGHPLKELEGHLVWRLVLKRVADPKTDDDFEVLENVIAVNWGTGPMVYILATEGMRLVPIGRVWEVHILPTNSTYKFMLQGMLLDAKSEEDRMKKFREQGARFNQQLKGDNVGHG
jgi:bacteriorhodopsin